VKNTLLVAISMLCSLPVTTLYADNLKQPPKLIVQITVDALRGDLLNRYRHNFGPNGFNYLINNGVYYKNAHYQHGNTETIVGHASLATGAPPSVHGMVGNIWFDDSQSRIVYNIEDANYNLLTQGAGVNKKTEIDSTQAAAKSQGRSPSNIRVSTFSDEVVMASAGIGKAFAVSVKDRGAVALAGHSGKAFWFDKATGTFVTSDYYYETYPSWVTVWNNQQLPAKYSGTVWQPSIKKDNFTLKDLQQKSKLDLAGFGSQFPHHYGKKEDKYFTTKLTLSPAGDELTADFAKTLLVKEDLGQDNITDFLSVSFSSNDYVIHVFGPSSQEAEDNLVRLDSTLAEFFKQLDSQVGLENTLIVLSADHGAPESADYAHSLGIDHASYFAIDTLINGDIKLAVKKRFGLADKAFRTYAHPYVYLDKDYIASKNVKLADVQTFVAELIRKQQGVYAAYAETDILHNQLVPSRIARLVSNNHFDGRSGDIYIVLNERGYVNDFDGLTVSSTHGSVWQHDTHVPIIFAGYGIKQQAIYRAVTPYDIAPTLALSANTTIPSGATGQGLVEVLQK